ncbi:hypothetical protein [Rugamonas sp.]|uniref:hypothetical protein n=1 Tax=Rugamonas sp. TaxID=1926287 RepID=UPI0026010306|nr:hypothetical protein [Rugamonas sp.]
MTTISSVSSLLPTLSGAAARALAATPAPPADITPASTIVALSPSAASLASSTDGLPSMQPPVFNAPVWEKKSSDAITSLMTVNYAAQPLSGRYQGLGAALLTRLATDGGDYSQSVLQSATASSTGATASTLDTLSSNALHGAAANQISLDIKTADGIKVTVTLGSQDKGLAVQIKSSGKLSDADRAALGQLAAAFQSAIDGIGAVPPKPDLSGLSHYNATLLSSLDLHAQVQLGGGQSQTMDFHADSTQRSVAMDGPAGAIKVSVDLSHLAGLGDSRQRSAAMDSYLKQFDQAASRGKADAAMLTTFKDAFEQMNASLPQHDTGRASASALSAGDHAMMTGLADFSASMTERPSYINPMRPGEADTFSYQTSQTTTVGGHGPADRSISQQQHSHLDASFHQPLSAGLPLALDGSKQSQNYYFEQISDDASSDAEVRYDKGTLAQASVQQTAQQSTRMMKYVMGQLSEDTTTPTAVRLTRDLLDLLQAAQKKPARTPQDAALSQQALAALHNTVLLQPDPSGLHAAGGVAVEPKTAI